MNKFRKLKADRIVWEQPEYGAGFDPETGELL